MIKSMRQGSAARELTDKNGGCCVVSLGYFLIGCSRVTSAVVALCTA